MVIKISIIILGFINIVFTGSAGNCDLLISSTQSFQLDGFDGSSGSLSIRYGILWQ